MLKFETKSPSPKGYVISIQPISSHPSALRVSLIFFSHLYTCLQNSLSPSDLPPQSYLHCAILRDSIDLIMLDLGCTSQSSSWDKLSKFRLTPFVLGPNIRHSTLFPHCRSLYASLSVKEILLDFKGCKSVIFV